MDSEYIGSDNIIQKPAAGVNQSSSVIELG